MSTRAQGLQHTSAPFPGHNQGSGWEVKQPSFKPVPIRDAGAAKGGIPYYATMVTPQKYPRQLRFFF